MSIFYSYNDEKEQILSNGKKHYSRGIVGGIICAVIWLIFGVARREGESGGFLVACYMAPVIIILFAIIGFFIAYYFKPYE